MNCPHCHHSVPERWMVVVDHPQADVHQWVCPECNMGWSERGPDKVLPESPVVVDSPIRVGSVSDLPAEEE